MSQRIDVEVRDGIALLRPKDDDLGPDQAEELRAVVKSLENKAPKAIILNFSLVEYMSSIFLSAIVEIFKDLHEKGRKFALSELNHKNLEIIRTTKLDTVIPVYENVHDALAAMHDK